MILETTEMERKGGQVVQCQCIFASFLYLFALCYDENALFSFLGFC